MNMKRKMCIRDSITAVFGYSVAIYVLLEDTMRWNAQSSDCLLYTSRARAKRPEQC